MIQTIPKTQPSSRARGEAVLRVEGLEQVGIVEFMMLREQAPARHYTLTRRQDLGG